MQQALLIKFKSFNEHIKDNEYKLKEYFNEYSQFMMFSFIFGCCYGIFEVAINLQASNIEKKLKLGTRKIILGTERISVGFLVNNNNKLGTSLD